MYLAKEHLYSVDAEGESFQLVVPKGSEVRDEDFELLGLAKNDKRVMKIGDDPKSLSAAHVELGLLAKAQAGG